jgi:tetratricopeptide (TPR) repeat protein
MKNNYLKLNILFSITLGLLFTPLVAAEDFLDRAKDVPEEFKGFFMDGTLYESLIVEKKKIDDQRIVIEYDIGELNKECSHVSNRDPKKVSDCASKQGDLYDRIDKYELSLHKYHVKMESAPKNFKNTKKSLNEDNYSTSGFWLDWIEYMRQENITYQNFIKETRYKVDAALEDLTSAYNYMNYAKKSNDLEERTVALESLRKAHVALRVIEEERLDALGQKSIVMMATSAMNVGKYEEAIDLFKKAVDAEDNSFKKEKLRKALGLALYKRDQIKNVINDDPRIVILLDSLEAGKGSYEKSMEYLNNEIITANNNEQAQNFRDVLIFVEGKHSIDQVVIMQKEIESMKDTIKLPDDNDMLPLFGSPE